LLLAGAAGLLGAFYGCIMLLLVALRWMDPPTTAVQIERHVHALASHEPYRKRYQCVPLSAIGPNLQHAVIAAEDARFFEHHGFDWKEVRSAMADDLESGKPRGASTVTQQLVRNLFLSTDRSLFRKAVECSIVPLTELILPKRRILELYLNVIEWGPGVYGAHAAAHLYFHAPPAALTRKQAAQLAALLPAPLTRRPGQPSWYVARILNHMSESGW
jgi:monofunctional biosynthetic peptidoglycan transglycosylase